VRHSQGYPAPAGTVVFDDVRVMTVAEQAQLPAQAGAAVTYENLARGKRYTLNPPPGYSYCTDAADEAQLTDGQYTVGYFWTQKSTVGWSGERPVIITMDLGAHVPVRGVSLNTAAGVAGVSWPMTIMLLISVDGRAYHALGDLVEISQEERVPPQDRYAVHRFRTDAFKTHGRYLKFVIDPGGPYCFVDEIEVYRGEDAWRELPLPGKEMWYPREYYEDNVFNASIKRRIGASLAAAANFILGSDLEAAVKQRLKDEFLPLEAEIAALPKYAPDEFRAVFPLNDVHARVFALFGKARAAQGRPPLVVWGANPWDFLGPTQLPEDVPAAAVKVAAMRGEVRAGAVNLTNCTAEAAKVGVTFAGLPGGQLPGYITVHEVAWTDTRQGAPVAAALPEVAPGPAGLAVSAPAGMTRQVWFSVAPRAVTPGTHRGHVVLSAPGLAPLKVPFTLRVFDLDFPAEPALHVGGWDYTDADRQYGVTPENCAALIAHLRERYVDAPWATCGVMPYGTFDAEGALATSPDTTRLERWLERWPGARRYCVFNAVGDNIGGAKIGTRTFAARVGAWIRFWVRCLRDRGIKPDQLALLLVDEPHRNEQDATIIAWAKAIRAAEPDVLIWEDPTYSDPTEAVPEMMEVAHVLCPNRPMMLKQGADFVEFYRKQRASGRRLEFYSCSGPARLLDPYAYHRLQAWTCFQMGAEASYFWAFGDTGNGDSWNEYATKRTSYTPLFLGPDSVTAGKHMEAIRESVQDFEYLVMLRDRIAATPGRRVASTRLRAAQELLKYATDRVLNAENVNELEWRKPKDRGIADTVRIEIGNALEELR